MRPWKSFKVGSLEVDIFHLQFADDTLIIGKCSIENASNLYRILRCFNLASGLKVNFFKSKLFGVGVDSIETHNLASILSFQPSTLSCSYLGLPIGANMNKAINWKPIIDKFHKRLTSWKARTLSYGGRLTLLKSVHGALGSLDNNKIPWIAWKKVCSPKSCGGLGVGSLNALNLAMMSKWLWRFHLEELPLETCYHFNSWLSSKRSHNVLVLQREGRRNRYDRYEWCLMEDLGYKVCLEDRTLDLDKKGDKDREEKIWVDV
nr:RNA-directed DNA polymerase, eukaryota, reverse transcriptase zinc-binding domain protein [Tanacetum cinerariifolium]